MRLDETRQIPVGALLRASAVVSAAVALSIVASPLAGGVVRRAARRSRAGARLAAWAEHRELERARAELDIPVVHVVV